VFERSAREAGFFEHGNTRLVQPALVPLGGSSPSDTVNGTDEKPDGGGSIMEDPLMIGLLNKLPPPGSIFLKNDRKRWLNALEVNFDFIYEGSPDEEAAAPPQTLAKDGMRHDGEEEEQDLGAVFKGG
jgi:hypothetical protein